MSPLCEERAGSVAALGEVELLRRIRQWLGSSAPAAPHGMGDDTAVLPAPDANLVTTDSLVYLRHFDAATAPELAGRKLLARNLSDIAAMGGAPREAVMAGFLPPATSLAWLEAFTRGLADCARAHRVAIAGGDLTQTDGFLGFNLTLLGSAAEPLLRTGAAIGDRIWVTGTLGGSIRGKHLHFEPRLREGQWLGRQGRTAIRALIDLTDGLAKDLPALLPDGAAAEIDLTAIPASSDARLAAGESGRSVIHHAFADGEDYELLFITAAAVDPESFAANWRAMSDLPLSCIGQLVERSGTALLRDRASGQALSFGTGYEHFGSA